tara:strand:+ start:867 stop:1877 length:1011 start_codon:yes stop_codon:yes gene_type:complete
MQNIIYDTILGLLPSKKKTSPSGWTSFSGPCCVHNGESQDKRGRAGITGDGTGVVSYHCFNCGFKTHYRPGFHLNYKLRKLLQWLGADDKTIKGLQIEALRLKEDAIELGEIEEHEEVTFEEKQYPSDSETLLHWIHNPEKHEKQIAAVAEYAIARGLESRLNELRWSPSRAGNLNQRLIIPFFYKGKFVGYTARAINDNVQPKYLNYMQPGYVFNIDEQNQDRKVTIVTEGPIDALKIGGVGINSNMINDTQADLLDSLGKDVIVVPDQDNAGSKVIDTAIEYGWSVAFPDWEDKVKDVSDAVDNYGKLYTLWSILNSAQTSKIKIELMRKKLAN